MHLANLTPAASSFYSKIILDYLDGNELLRSFYTYPHSFEGLEEALMAKQFSSEKRELLKDTLQQRYLTYKIKPSGILKENISSLADPNTYTITTGHQLCLMTGPVYFLYKIIHAIKVSMDLNAKHLNKHFVPVYWMASEDHDFEEIRTFQVNGEKFSWEHINSGDAVGHYPTDGINDLLKTVADFFNGKPPGFLNEATAIYASSKNLSEATFRLVNHLFADYGVVVVEPNDVAIKQHLQSVMEADILGGISYKALESTNKKLVGLNYPQQINGRPVNFFYLFQGKRELIHLVDEQYTIGEKNFTKTEMKEMIQLYPERFSPNVVLRPVYQEAILPNIAYIGGPGEVAYWLQLKEVFAAHQVAYPVVLLRNSFAIIDAPLKHKRDKLNLPDEIYFGRFDRIHVEAVAVLRPSIEIETLHDISEKFQLLIDDLAKIDNGFMAEMIKYKTDNTWFMEHFSKRLRKRKVELEKEKLDQVYAIRNALFSNSVPAERVNNLMQYVNANDTQAFIQTLLNNATSITQFVPLISY